MHYIQHTYNHAKHSSTQVYQFESCLGYFPKPPLDFIFGKNIAVHGHSDVDKARNFNEQIQLVHQRLQEQLEKSKAKYKARDDKHRVDHDFQVEDQVWIYISKKILQGECCMSCQGNMVMKRMFI